MTILHNAGTFNAVPDGALEDQRKQAYRIDVPKPATTLLLGERIRAMSAADRAVDDAGAPIVNEADRADFGYPGVSLQTEEGCFINVKKKTVQQSGDSVTYQTRKDWTQYASHNMYLSVRRKMYLASNRDMIISTDTAQGATFVSNHGADLDNVDFDEGPSDKLRDKLDATMERVTPKKEEDGALGSVLNALSAFKDALTTIADDAVEAVLAMASPTIALKRFQNKSAKPVELMLQTALVGLGYKWGKVDEHILHYASRADDDANDPLNFLESVKKVTKGLSDAKKALLGLPAELAGTVTPIIDGVADCWNTVMDEYGDLRDYFTGDDAEVKRYLDDETRGDLGAGVTQVGDDQNYNYPEALSANTKKSLETVIKPARKILDILDAVDDLVEDLQYLLSFGQKKPPMQLMSSGQLTIDSMRDFDSFAADGYNFRSNRGGFGVRVRGQADLMGQARAQVISAGPTSLIGYQAVEIASAGPVVIGSQKNSVEVTGRKVYLGCVELESSMRKELEEAATVTSSGGSGDDDPYLPVVATHTEPPKHPDEATANWALTAPAGHVGAPNPFLPSNLAEESPTSPPTQYPHPFQGFSPRPIELATDYATSHEKTEHIQLSSTDEQLFVVGAHALKWSRADKGEDPTGHCDAFLRLRKEGIDQHPSIDAEAKAANGTIQLKVGDWVLKIAHDGITLGKEGGAQLVLDAQGAVLRRDTNTKLTLDASGAHLAKNSGHSIDVAASGTTTTGKFHGG